MGTGAIIIGFSAQAFTWSLIAAVILLIARSFMQTKRLGMVCWVAALLMSAIVHGLLMFAIPSYANSLIGEVMTSIRILVMPVVLLAVFLYLFGLMGHPPKNSRETD